MSVERELAIHETEIKHLQDDMDRMAADIADIRKSLSEINKTLSEAKGGWKTLVWIAGLASAISGTIGFLLSNFTGK